MPPKTNTATLALPDGGTLPVQLTSEPAKTSSTASPPPAPPPAPEEPAFVVLVLALSLYLAVRLVQGVASALDHAKRATLLYSSELLVLTVLGAGVEAWLRLNPFWALGAVGGALGLLELVRRKSQ